MKMNQNELKIGHLAHRENSKRMPQNQMNQKRLIWLMNSNEPKTAHFKSKKRMNQMNQNWFIKFSKKDKKFKKANSGA